METGTSRWSGITRSWMFEEIHKHDDALLFLNDFAVVRDGERTVVGISIAEVVLHMHNIILFKWLCFHNSWTLSFRDMQTLQRICSRRECLFMGWACSHTSRHTRTSDYYRLI